MDSLSPRSSITPPVPVRRGRIATLLHLSRRQWFYFPRLFSRGERIVLVLLAACALLALAILTGRTIAYVTVVEPAVGGILREGALKVPRFVNPLYASEDTDRDLSTLVFSKLIRYDHEGRPIYDLAREVEVDEDGTIYTVWLREGVRWHDGEPLTADDVVFTIRAIQDPEYKSPLRQNWQGVSIEKLDDSTVRFTLRQPYAPFLENLAVGIIPEHLWRKIPRDSAPLSDLNIKPIGSGPYSFQKLTRHEDGTITSVVLARNRTYHLDGPYLKEIHFSFYANEAELIRAYLDNEIDSFMMLEANSVAEAQAFGIRANELHIPKLFAVFLNQSAHAALGRKAIREALAVAIDRAAIINQVAGNNGVILNSAIPPDTFGFNADIAPLPFDPEAAKNLIAKDGWKDSDHDGILERIEGTGRNRTTVKLEFKIVTSDAPELAETAELIAQMWQAVGVRATVETKPVGELEREVIRPRSYEILLFGEVFGHDPDPFAFWHTSQLKDPGLNIALYSNRSVDELLESARRTADPTAREEKYRQFQKTVAEEFAAIFLYSPTYRYIVRPEIQGVALGVIALPDERFSEVHQWYEDTRRVLR